MIVAVFSMQRSSRWGLSAVPSEICAGRLHAKRFLTPFRRLYRLVPGSSGQGETEPKKIGEGSLDSTERRASRET